MIKIIVTLFDVCNSSLVITILDCGLGGPCSSPEWVTIFYEALSTAQGLPFRVVHWVPVLSNIKTATGCESNRQLQL